MYLEDCLVIENRCIVDEYYLMKIKVSEKLASASKAGQFFMLKTSNEKILLRRPISLHYVDREKNEIEFYYEIKGIGTENMKNFKKGEKMNVQGPLGTGFSIDITKKKVLLVGGGMGNAPMKLLIEELKKENEVSFIAGGRNKDALDILSNFNDEGYKRFIATDDGSIGKKGTVIDLMEELLSETKFDMVYTCGPHGMMVAVAKKAADFSVKCQISLENRMACGVKACVGCSIKTKEGMKKVCYDGPVFDSETIVDYQPKETGNICCGG